MGIVILNVIGQCGPLLGTNIFPKPEGPRYIKGQSICAAFMGFNCLLALVLRTLLVWENRQLDKKYGTKAEREERKSQAKEDTAVGEEDYSPDFRYVL